MANPTTNYSWTLPVENTGTNWDATLNTLFQDIDTQVFSNEGVADAAVPVAGGVTMTGNVKNFTTTETIVDKSSMSGAVTLDLSTSNEFFGTVAGNITSITISNPAASGTLHYLGLELLNGGAFTITWPSSFNWDGGSAPTLQTAGTDIIIARTRDGGTTWRAVATYSKAT